MSSDPFTAPPQTPEASCICMNKALVLGTSLFLAALSVGVGCRAKYREDLDYSYNVEQTWPLDDLNHGEIVQFESVFWEPDDTVSLRKLIVEDAIAAGRDVLEIGTGTGVLSVLCLQNDARRVVATDVNQAAVANARYNAAMLVPDKQLDVRQVPSEKPEAFSVIGPSERFDLIVSNPPWEDGVIQKPADHAFYDPGFVLMTSLLDGLADHLNPGGRCLLAYGHAPAIKLLKAECEQRGFDFKILDDRDLESLEKDFLPGMLVEVRPPLRGRSTGESAVDSEQKDGPSDIDSEAAKDASEQAPNDPSSD